MYQTKCQPSEIAEMPQWKFEAFIERLNTKNDEEREKQKKQAENEKKQKQNQNQQQHYKQPKITPPRMPRF